MPGILIKVAIETLAVAVKALNNDVILFIVAVDVGNAVIVLNSVKSLLTAAVVADVIEKDLTYLKILEMVLVLVDVTDNVGVRVIVSWSLIATLFTLDPFIAIFN